MKKLISLFLALIMILSCTLAMAESETAAETTDVTETAAAAASSVDLRLTLDRELAKNALVVFGATEEQAASLDPAIAVLGALGMKITYSGSSAQVDLKLNDTEIGSLAGELTDQEVVLGSTLFPNYLLSFSLEKLQSLASQFIPMLSSSDSTEEGGSTSGFSADQFQGVIESAEKFVQACAAAVTPGEAEQGTFEFEGYTFDTRTPMNVDVKAIADAEKTFVTELVTDPAIQSANKYNSSFDAEQIISKNEEFMSEEHLPDVTVNVYNNSDGSEPYFVETDTTFKEDESRAFRYTLLSTSSTDIKMTFDMPAHSVNVVITIYAGGYRVDYTIGEKWFAYEIKADDKSMVMDVYVSEKDRPTGTLAVYESVDGTLTLPLEQEGKTVLTLDDMTGEKAGEAATGLMTDIMVNGWGQFYAAATQAVPEMAELITMITTSQAQTETTETTETETTEAP